MANMKFIDGRKYWLHSWSRNKRISKGRAELKRNKFSARVIKERTGMHKGWYGVWISIKTGKKRGSR